MQHTLIPSVRKRAGAAEALDSADLMIIATRFRHPDAEQAKHIAAFLDAGKPVIGLRTATHAFQGGEKIGGDLTYDQLA